MTNAVIGFVTSVPVNHGILPFFGAPVNFGRRRRSPLVFTFVSVLRSYLVHRFFAVHIKRFSAWRQDIYDDFHTMTYCREQVGVRLGGTEVI